MTESKLGRANKLNREIGVLRKLVGSDSILPSNLQIKVMGGWEKSDLTSSSTGTVEYDIPECEIQEELRRLLLDRLNTLKEEFELI